MIFYFENNSLYAPTSHWLNVSFRLNKLVVKNKTSHPVPDYLKDALMENNLDRGLKFTLSHLMNDQMLLGNLFIIFLKIF